MRLIPIAIAAALAAFAAPISSAPISRASAQAPGLAATIVALEEARLAAFHAGDKPAFARLVADDLVMVHSNGDIGTKADEMANMRPETPGHPLPTLHLEDTVVHAFAGGAVLTGSLVERIGDRVALRLRFTNVYERRAGRWQLVAGQLTKAQTN